MIFIENELRFHNLANLFINLFIINENRELTYKNKNIH